ncbi:hypothetical protein NQ317_002745, partial [Molorchus minor]
PLTGLFLVPPSIQILPADGKIVRRKGSPVSFECKANGNPTPTVQWSKKDGLLPSGLQVENGYLMNINEVQRQDAGVYQCTASNGIGQPVTGEIRLHVLYPPEVTVVRSWVNSGEGLEAKLDCVVYADPPAEVTWYQDSFALQPTDKRIMSKNGNTHTLTIRNVQLSDFGNYSCIVSNSIGRDKNFIELSGKPGPAKIISSQYSNPHDYDMTWVVQSVFPIIEVRILYRRIMSNISYHRFEQWHDLLVKPSQTYNPTKGERTQTYRLTNLQPDSVYEGFVQTKNQHGYGDLSQVHQWFTSQRGRILVQHSSAVTSYCRKQFSVALVLVALLVVNGMRA